MKTPKAATPKNLTRINTPKSGMIQKKNKHGATPFKGSVGVLQLLQDEFNDSKGGGKKVKRKSCKSSPEVELGLKIEKLLEKGMSSTETSPVVNGKAEKQRRKSVVPTMNSGTPLKVSSKMSKRLSLGSALISNKTEKLDECETPSKSSIKRGFGGADKSTPKVKFSVATDQVTPSKKKKGHVESPTSEEGQREKSPDSLKVSSKKKTPKKKTPKLLRENLTSNNTSLVPTDSPDQTEITPLLKKKVKKGKKIQEEAPPVNKADESETKCDENGAHLLNYDSVKEVTDTLLKVHNLKAKQSGKLLADDVAPIMMCINCVKSPITPNRFLRLNVPHQIFPESTEVCLIAADLPKSRKNPATTRDHYREKLNKLGIDWIKEVIPFRTLQKEYSQYEQKRRLCQRFDAFIVEGKISFRIYKLIGKFIYTLKRFPIPVSDITCKLSLEKALKKVTIFLKPVKNSFAFQIGHTEQPAEEVVANIRSIANSLEKEFPGGWMNMRSIHLSTNFTPRLPFYMSLASKNEVKKPVSLHKKKRRHPVTDELSTIPGANVTVYPDGRVIVKKNQNESSSDEEEDGEINETTSKSGVASSEEGEESDQDITENEKTEAESTKKAKKNKAQKRVHGEKTKKKEEKHSSSDEGEIEAAEEEYLRDIVKEFQHIKENEKNKSKSASKKDSKTKKDQPSKKKVKK